jgi:hypothetical protein
MDSTKRTRTASPPHSFYSSKGTAIPRPSLQQPRASSEANGAPHVNGLPPVKPRSRTYSQPGTFNPSFSRNGNGAGPVNPVINGSSPALPTPESSRSTSPHYIGRVSDVKPTRIPMVALGRSPSSSSRGHHQPSNINTVVSDGRNGYGPYTPPSPESPSDLWRVDQSALARQLRSTINLQHSRLLHEPPPFQSGDASSIDHSQDHSHDDDAMFAGRRSNDSEERPFEHWYRGEVSRNGGVGELRLGKRMEMLDIANYGHTLRKASPQTQSRIFPPTEDTPRRRKRADSASEIEGRESFYLDEERAKEIARVLDEGPPTDLDPDGDSERSFSMQQYALAPPPSPGFRPSAETGTNHPPPSSVQPTRIPVPVPTRQSSEPPRTRTPTLTERGASEPPRTTPNHRGASEPPSFPSTSTTPTATSLPRSASQPQPQKRGKSPGASTPASKRSKATAKSIASKKALEEKNRRSVAYYPTPADGVDMVDAIPSWTQPVPASGNWDEVRPMTTRMVSANMNIPYRLYSPSWRAKEVSMGTTSKREAILDPKQRKG